MLTQQAAINITKEFLSDIKKIGINIRKAYLFGSFAHNSQHEHSDIDIAIIADEFIGVGIVDIKLFTSVLRNYKYIHSKTYSPSDYDEGDPFLREIIKKGIEIQVN